MARSADIRGGGRGDRSRRPLAARSRPHSGAGGREHLSVTGVGNAVTAVLLAYRALDTLLESIVVVFALIGVWSLAPDRVWGGYPGPLHQADPNGVLAYLARVLPPIGIIVGLYIFWIGADLPGGKFQGATILAAMWLLVMMAVLPMRRRSAGPGCGSCWWLDRCCSSPSASRAP